MSDWMDMLASIRFVEVLDFLIVTVLAFFVIVAVRSSRSRLALAGVALLTALYFLSRQFGLTLTSWVLQGVVAATVLLVIVVFDEDLRRLFERFATLFVPKTAESVSTDDVEPLKRALCRLARQFRGALVVLPGTEPIVRHLDGGVELDGRLSEVLLLSLFDPNSPGHDGAVVVERGRVVRFATHLPLSSDHAQLGQRGTRHAAALGLTERCDAMCLVVSEERGEISVAQAGQLRTLARPELVGSRIEEFLRSVEPSPRERGAFGLRRFASSWREMGVALAVTAVLWALAVPGSGEATAERVVPVRVLDLPEGYVLRSVDPPNVTVTLSGRRVDLWWLPDARLQARVRTYLVEAGRRSFQIEPQQVTVPANLDVVSIRPDTVKIDVEKPQRPPSAP